jgi:translation initiation factor 5B
MRIRQPILVVLGHVDAGKTSLLDKIRGTAVQLKEAGGITQHIGASFLPIQVIEKIAHDLIQKYKIKLTIPGVLIIDTPGHEIFSNLRKRGGSVADMAIVVVDIQKGFEKQTYESVEILKQRKVPFVVALNKLDRFEGYKAEKEFSFLSSLSKQTEWVKEKLDERIYEIVSILAKLGFEAERFDRVRDFSKQVAIVPTSAIYGIGIAELLLVVSGICQNYLKSSLAYTEGPAQGVVLEVKEEHGLGTTIDAIIYNGILKKNDTIVLASLNGIITTKVKALLLPKPLDEMRAPEDKFKNVEEVVAAVGVKIVASDLNDVIAGSPLYVATPENYEKIKKLVEEEIESLRIKSDITGVVVKTDTLGSLEALTGYLKSMGIPIRSADIGPVTKKDVFEAYLSKEMNAVYGVILAFNVKVLPEAEEEINSKKIKLIKENVIYRLVEEYLEWSKKIKEEEKNELKKKLPTPAIIKVLPGYVFRRSDPAIIGIEVELGKIKPGLILMNKNKKILGSILQIQDQGKPIPEAVKGMQVAISIKGEAFVGRNLFEGEELFSVIQRDEAKIWLEKLKDELNEEEIKYLERCIREG